MRRGADSNCIDLEWRHSPWVMSGMASRMIRYIVESSQCSGRTMHQADKQGEQLVVEEAASQV